MHQAALAYATANAERQLSVEQLLMEEQLLAFFLSFKFKLAEQALLVYADTHGTKLEAVSKHRIPYKDVAIESCLAVLGNRRPVVIVRSTAIMFLSVAELSADTLNKYGTILPTDSILTFLRSLVGIHVEEVLAVNEMYVLWKERLKLREALASEELRAQYGTVDTAPHSQGTSPYGPHA